MNNKLLKKSNKNKAGFTLLGVIFSLFLVSFVLVAIAGLVSRIYSTSRNSKDAFVAAGLAKEGIEVVRALRDSNWLYYPNADTTVLTDPVSKMKWRGVTNGSEECDTAGNCLKNICDGAFVIDPRANDEQMVNPLSLGLSNPYRLLQKIGGSEDGFYGHQEGDDSVYDRVIQIRTLDPGSVAGDENHLSLPTGSYKPFIESGCGEENDSSIVTALKPRPFLVTSIVQWTDRGTNKQKQVILEEIIYDTVTKRP